MSTSWLCRDSSQIEELSLLGDGASRNIQMKI